MENSQGNTVDKTNTNLDVQNVNEANRQDVVDKEESAESIHSEPDSIQAGVQKALILKKAWSRTSLAIAFSSLLLTTLVLTFSDYAHLLLSPYVTSAFRSHSALSASTVVGNITRIVAYPVIAKLSDVFGRAEMFAFAICFQTLSYILFATSTGIGQYFAANLLDSIGSTGFVLTQQIFIADATNLVNRAFWSTLPESITTIPALYLGSMIGEGILNNTTWRWNYGMWSIITPVVATPLITTMIVLQRRAAKNGLDAKSFSVVAGCKPSDSLPTKIFHLFWTELDFFGMVLLVAALSLILIPLSLSGSFNPGRWREPSFIAMLVVGVFLLICFLVWDLKYAKKPYIPTMMVNSTVIAGCAIQVFDFMGYTVFTIMFPSYLQVAGHYSPALATRIDNSLRVAFQISGLFVAIGMKYTKNSQMWILCGPPLVMLGQGIMVYLVNKGDGSVGNEASFIASKVVSGIGRALFQTAAQVSVQAIVSRQEVAIVTGIFQASNSIGAAIGGSVSGAIWRNTLPEKLEAYLPQSEKSSALRIFQSIAVAKEYEFGTPSRLAIDQGYRESQKLLAIVSTGLCVPSIILMWFMKNVKLDEEDQKDEKDVDRAIQKIEKHSDEHKQSVSSASI